MTTGLDGLYPRLVSIGLSRMTGLFEDLFGGETLGGGRAKDGTAAASRARRRNVFAFMTGAFLLVCVLRFERQNPIFDFRANLLSFLTSLSRTSASM